MIAREYNAADAHGLDLLLGFNRAGDVRLDRDRIVVAGPVGSPFACLIWRPVAFIHEFHCGKGLVSAAAAASLTSYAVGDALNRPHHVKEAIFGIEPGNIPMERYVIRERATKQDGTFYSYSLRGESR